MAASPTANQFLPATWSSREVLAATIKRSGAGVWAFVRERVWGAFRSCCCQ